MRVSLDSDAYSRLVRGDESVGNPVRDADEVLMSAVVVGELLAGFRNGTRFETNYAELQSFLAAPGVSLVVIGPETGTELVSGDRHYEAVDGISWQRFGAA